MGRVVNRFFRKDDRDVYKDLNKRFEVIYRDIMKSGPHKGNGTQSTVIHWSREVEYPWSIESAELLRGMRVADLGCGGSPLPYYLYHDKGCEVWGIDKYLYPNERNSLWGYTCNPSKRFPEITWVQKKLENVCLRDLHRVVCVSVFEHMNKKDRLDALSNVYEMLMDEGLFVLTMDVNDSQPLSFVSRFIEDADARGLRINGAMDLSVPAKEMALGVYHVVGMVFKKI